MATLLEQVTEAWKAAMRSGDTLRRDTLAGVRAAIKNAEINARTSGAGSAALDDAAVQQVIEREAKKRREAIEEYERVGRADRAAGERAELEILQEFLPAPLTDEELEALVREAIKEVGAEHTAAMGQVMQALMPRIAGRADGKRASALVRKSLG
ncbi:MAG TPA: GatB/YqeY domain-containing protein [Abditibacteriaceae bacterium]|nr:GatB/YqeY domain-containing protein [Abditibacteriaceae bacterium]